MDCMVTSDEVIRAHIIDSLPPLVHQLKLDVVADPMVMDKKQTFHQSKLRTTFYYSYVEKGIENLNSKDLFVGKSILNAWIDEDGIPMSGVGYFADIWKNPKNHRDIKNYPLFGLSYTRKYKKTAEQGTGTDIYILEPELKRSWIQDTEKRVIDNLNFERGMFEVHIKAESKTK